MEEANIPSIPSSELTSKQLKWSYWYVTNKLFLRRSLIIFLIAVAVLFWLYALYGLITYLLDFNRLNTEAANMLHSPSAAQVILDQSRPQPLKFSEVIVLPAASGHYDLAVEARNPNTDWLGLFDYRLNANGSTSPARSGFILPGADKYLIGIGSDSAQANFTAENFRWQKIANFSALKNARDRFVIENEQYSPPAKLGEPSRISFDITNDSSYGYWQVNAIALLYSRGSIVAVNYAAITRLESLETRTIEMNWAQDLPTIDSIQIIPEVNYLDAGSIIPPGY
ncbi:MAG: hypothetical protein WC668_05080 [Patescibacteria group bacterium]|jgi:hypothetical protein